MSYDFQGKVALITGALSKRGIAYHTAIKLAQDGADIVVSDLHSIPTADPEEDKKDGWHGLESAADQITAMGRKCLAIVADVTKSDQVADLVNRTYKELGRIDILVNGAGLTQIGRELVLDTSDETWQQMLSVNLTGSFICSRAVAKIMIDQGQGGKIVNIASLAAKRATRFGGAYGAAKAGLVNLTQTMALELAPYHINVNAICPGATATELGRGLPLRREARRLGVSYEEASKHVYVNQIANIPQGRVAQPEDQANAIAFLASKDSDHITGIALNVNGGILMAP